MSHGETERRKGERLTTRASSCFTSRLYLAGNGDEKGKINNLNSYLLMLLPSFSLSPAAPVLVALSLPAKSTRLSLPTFSPDVWGRKQGTAPVRSLHIYYTKGIKLHLWCKLLLQALWEWLDLSSVLLLQKQHWSHGWCEVTLISLNSSEFSRGDGHRAH